MYSIEDSLITEESSNEKNSSLEKDFEKFCKKDVIPVVFKWCQGGSEAYITGNFTNWEEKIKMRASGQEFNLVYELPRDKYAYKFIVDNQWCFSSDHPTVADIDGYVNNLMDLSDFQTE